MTTWVLLRGLTREARHWGDFSPCLSRAFDGAAVITLDLPGNGMMCRITSPVRIDAVTEYCRAQLSNRGVPPPYRLVAISLGGIVAVDWAARHAHEIDAAVLINTSMRPFSAFYHRLRVGAWPTLLRLMVPGLSFTKREELIFALTSNLPQAPAGLIDIWVAIRRSRPVTMANAVRQLVAATQFRVSATANSVDMLVLASKGDRLVDARCSQALAQKWGCEIAMHASAGHDLPLDDADWVVSQIGNWMARRGATAGTATGVV